MELNLLDSKILQELSVDAKQTSAQIGKKIGTSQQVVNYRINNLVDKKIIQGFFTSINFGYFGLSNYQAMMKLAKITKTQKKIIIKKLSKGMNVLLLSECGGKWDLIINIMEENQFKFQERFLKLISEFEDSILNYDLFATMEGVGFSEENLTKSKRITKQTHFGKEGKINISRNDLIILKEISKNGRYNIIDLESKIGLNHKTIIQKIRKMKEVNIISGFKSQIDSNKLSEFRSRVLLDLKKITTKDIEDLTKFLSTQKNVIGTLKMIGKWNFGIGLKTLNQKDMWQSYQEIQEYLGDKVRAIELVPIFKKYDYNYFPESLLEEHK